MCHFQNKVVKKEVPISFSSASSGWEEKHFKALGDGKAIQWIEGRFPNLHKEKSYLPVISHTFGPVHEFEINSLSSHQKF
jgi:hypothetical protein